MATAAKQMRLSSQNGAIAVASDNPEDKMSRGAIVRVYMKNFVTYKETEVRPGPFLNVVIGPNGTGKSTLVCAICIGLAGKTTWLGRSNNVGDFIKHGETKAELEVELFNDKGQNYVIHSELEHSNTNGVITWKLNNKRVSKKEIENLVENDLNIQVGNLCQFLPQDRVAEFAKMTDQETLENTQKAVDTSLHRQQEELKQMRAEMRRFETSTDNERVDLESEIQKNKALEADVENFQRRKKYMDEIGVLNKKRPWLEYEAKRVEWISEKDKLKDKEEVVNRLKKESEPLKKQKEDADRLVKVVDKALAEKTQEMNECNKIANSIVNRNMKDGDKIDDLKNNLKVQEANEVSRKQRADLIQNSIAGLEAKLAEVESNESETNFGPILADLDRQLTETRHKALGLDNKIGQIDKDLSRLGQNLESQRTLHRRLMDVQNRRMDLLRQKHRPTYEAVEWLRNNLARFRATVHEPMMMVINVSDPADAKYVENHIAFRDLRAFVCEDPEDAELFLRVMRNELHLAVNVVQAPTEPSHAFRPQAPIQNYYGVGLRSYIREMFTAPDPVVSYLCRQYRIHSTPVGTEKAKANMDAIFTNYPDIGLFYSESSRIQNKKSKYSGHNLINTSSIRQGDCLSASLDQQRIDETKREIEVHTNDIESLRTNRKAVMEMRREVEIESQGLMQRKREVTTQMSQKRTLQEQIGAKRRQLQDCEASAVDMEALKQQATDSIKASFERRISLIQEHRRASEKQRNISGIRAILMLRQCQSRDKLDRLQSEFNEATELYRQEEAAFLEAQRVVNSIKADANRLRAEAINLCGMKATDARVPAALQALFDNLPNDVEEIDKEVFELQAKADCIGQVDQAKVREYETRRRRIEDLQTQLDTRINQFESKKRRMADLEAQWKPRLETLIQRIDKNFAKFMEYLGCAGEISLGIPVNPEDYEKYGIEIKVKFRAEQPLKKLTAHHQSGGERAVSTVLYMMSLQELTKCPFRCVDEINQGMDPVNERKIFQLVVDTACLKSKSQYFLLTPKLLANMIDECDKKSMTDMTVLTIYNGLGMVNHKEWSLKKFLRRRKTLIVDTQP